jgi:adenylate kinase family enzyme
MASVIFKLSTGDSYSREVESEEAAIKQVKSFFDRHDEYLRDWIRVDGNAWIARSAVVAVEVRADPESEAEVG